MLITPHALSVIIDVSVKGDNYHSFQCCSFRSGVVLVNNDRQGGPGAEPVRTWLDEVDCDGLESNSV